MSLTPSFPNPVQDSQACFRAVLDAMARPGTIHTIHIPLDPPAPLHQATAAILLTLTDPETPLFLPPEAAPAAPWIAFHCGAPLAPPESAAFALAPTPLSLAPFSPGTDDEPEQATTIILQLSAIGTGPAYQIEGPGLPAPTSFQAEGLPPTFLEEWAQAQSNFPRGIDVILCAGNTIAALPRTLRITTA